LKQDEKNASKAKEKLLLLQKEMALIKQENDYLQWLKLTATEFVNNEMIPGLEKGMRKLDSDLKIKENQISIEIGTTRVKARIQRMQDELKAIHEDREKIVKEHKQRVGENTTIPFQKRIFLEGAAAYMERNGEYCCKFESMAPGP
jgi:ABC-type phosphate transport system auxiliary subunit